VHVLIFLERLTFIERLGYTVRNCVYRFGQKSASIVLDTYIISCLLLMHILMKC
jgi:hypothetical protein